MGADLLAPINQYADTCTTAVGSRTRIRARIFTQIFIEAIENAQGPVSK